MLNFHCEHKGSCHNHGNDTIHHCCSRGQWRQSNSSVKFEVQQGIDLRLFAFMPLTSLHHFLIYALSFFGPTHFDWFTWISLRLYFLWKYQKDNSIRNIVHSQSCEKRLLALTCLSVHLSIRLHRTTRLPLEGFFVKFSYPSIFLKSVLQIPVSLKSDKNNGYFTRSLIYIFDHILLDSSQNENYFRQKL